MEQSHAIGQASDAPTLTQLRELLSQIEKGRITRDQLQGFLRGEQAVINVFDMLAGWQLLYQKLFKTHPDLSNVRIPKHRHGLDRLIVVAEGLTLNRAFDACSRNFSCWRHTDDLDRDVTHNDREPNKSTYAIWVRDVVEADRELKDLSADQLKDQRILGVTLLERLLYELKYWLETGQHLDTSNWTLCTGSRSSNGRVPFAFWRDKKFGFRWLSPRDAFDSLRVRAVVS